MKYLRKITLAQLPTALHEIPAFARRLGHQGKIYIKRDDLSGLAAGGNKTRKLEYLMADALQQGADAVITAGGLQSNHCLQTATAARKLGMDCYLVLSGEKPEHFNGNLFLDLLTGANIEYVTRAEREQSMEKIAADLRFRGKKPYVIPVGGSNPLGAVGYVMAMSEILRQFELMRIACNRIVIAASSGGTLAGLVLGAAMGGYTGKITGISIDRQARGADAFPPQLARLANQCAQLLEVDLRLKAEDFELEYGYLGAGYGVVGDNERRAVRMLAESEGLFVGPVYTGRALGALIDCIEKGKWQNETICFWHTGDMTALFDYSADLL
ncbi:MAG: D-cysteine desulfhydrase family protein [Candidatus Neomarinimicrobiota bacterium]|jgi:D-cysteine desulfhydrase|nr:D-cysteine desulfhydrase family protein [Candidatus Neomarinimicrobiota bacterium]MDD3966761.1 D-cysteine desulfhydrase family protein [Candidatus Neomarinimicrobiota bacterium]MDX9781223.1 D-cysteine desulfhydrase family protein [bacterium]